MNIKICCDDIKTDRPFSKILFYFIFIMNNFTIILIIENMKKKIWCFVNAFCPCCSSWAEEKNKQVPDILLIFHCIHSRSVIKWEKQTSSSRRMFQANSNTPFLKIDIVNIIFCCLPKFKIYIVIHSNIFICLVCCITCCNKKRKATWHYRQYYVIIK